MENDRTTQQNNGDSLRKEMRNLRTRNQELCLRVSELEKQLQDQRKLLSHSQLIRRHLSAIESVVPDIIYRLDPDGHITHISDAIRQYGYEPEDLIGRPILDLVHPDDQKKAVFRVNERRTGPRRTELLELRLLRKDRDDIPFELMSKFTHVQPTFLVSAEGVYNCDNPKSEAFVGTQGFARDITDQKLAAAELYRVSEHLRAVLDAVPGYVSWVSSDLKYIGVNRYLADHLGQPAEFFIGKDVGFQDPRQPMNQFIREFMAGEQSYDVREIEFPDPDGSRICLVAVQKYLDNRAAVLVGIDITSLKTAEAELVRYRDQLEERIQERTQQLIDANKQLEREMKERQRAEAELLRAHKLESIGLLAGGIAHDFNNLLTAVLGNISLGLSMLDESLPVHQRLEIAKRACLRAMELTHQLLVFSRGDVSSKRTTDIAALLKDSITFILQDSTVVCHVTIADDLLPVDVDPGQINQVFSNIIINAVQAMPSGGTLHITARNESIAENAVPHFVPGRYVNIVIRDEGVGIPDHDLTKVFDPYFTTKSMGNGLGLAIVYSIVTKHGGYISIESEPGRGTSVQILLPGSDKPVERYRDHMQEIPRGTGLILLMDDELLVRETARPMMEELGYRVVCAVSGEEAIRIFKHHMASGDPFDAVILDLTVPGGMGGHSALRELHQLDPDIRAVVSSGFPDNPVIRDYKKHGFSAVLNKPYQLKEIAVRLADLLSA